MMSDLKIGDVVYLKSGGLAMTINSKANYGNNWACTWFIGNEHNKANFLPDALTKENPNLSKNL